MSFDFADGLTEIIKTLTKVGEYWLSEPERTLEAQNRLLGGYLRPLGGVDEADDG